MEGKNTDPEELPLSLHSGRLSPSTASSPIRIPTRSTQTNSIHGLNYTRSNSPSPPPTTVSNSSSRSTPPEIIEAENKNSSFYQQLSIHIEQPVGSMSISPSSRDIVLSAYVC